MKNNKKILTLIIANLLFATPTQLLPGQPPAPSKEQQALIGTFMLIGAIMPMIQQIEAAVDQVQKSVNGTKTNIKNIASASGPLTVIDNTFGITDNLILTNESIQGVLKQLVLVLNVLGGQLVSLIDENAGTQMTNVTADVNRVLAKIDEVNDKLKALMPKMKKELTGITRQIDNVTNAIKAAQF